VGVTMAVAGNGVNTLVGAMWRRILPIGEVGQRGRTVRR
jgi:hypothetical protein